MSWSEIKKSVNDIIDVPLNRQIDEYYVDNKKTFKTYKMEKLPLFFNATVNSHGMAKLDNRLFFYYRTNPSSGSYNYVVFSVNINTGEKTVYTEYQISSSSSSLSAFAANILEGVTFELDQKVYTLPWSAELSSSSTFPNHALLEWQDRCFYSVKKISTVPTDVVYQNQSVATFSNNAAIVNNRAYITSRDNCKICSFDGEAWTLICDYASSSTADNSNRGSCPYLAVYHGNIYFVQYTSSSYKDIHMFRFNVSDGSITDVGKLPYSIIYESSSNKTITGFGFVVANDKLHIVGTSYKYRNDFDTYNDDKYNRHYMYDGSSWTRLPDTTNCVKSGDLYLSGNMYVGLSPSRGIISIPNDNIIVQPAGSLSGNITDFTGGESVRLFKINENNELDIVTCPQVTDIKYEEL